MQSDNEKNKEENKATTSEQLGKALLSEKEIRSVVRDFIAAYVSGQIKINFADANFIVAETRKFGNTIDYEKAVRAELDFKDKFTDNIAICVGTKKATPEELREAIHYVFTRILTFRHGQRIEGFFLDYDIERRINRLEEGMERVNTLVEEIVEWICGGVSGKP